MYVCMRTFVVFEFACVDMQTDLVDFDLDLDGSDALDLLPRKEAVRASCFLLTNVNSCLFQPHKPPEIAHIELEYAIEVPSLWFVVLC